MELSKSFSQQPTWFFTSQELSLWIQCQNGCFHHAEEELHIIFSGCKRSIWQQQKRNEGQRKNGQSQEKWRTLQVWKVYCSQFGFLTSTVRGGWVSGGVWSPFWCAESWDWAVFRANLGLVSLRVLDAIFLSWMLFFSLVCWMLFFSPQNSLFSHNQFFAESEKWQNQKKNV